MPQPMRQKGENMITVETLTNLGACSEGVAWFQARYPEGLSLEVWTRDEQIDALRSGGGKWLAWGVDRNLLPWWSLSRADLSRANLRGADLSEANLSGADLRGADLTGANLRGADLTGANLRGADLIWAYLSGANLSGAYLSRADLTGANLSGANLTGADLRQAVVCNHTVAPDGFVWPDGVVRVED